MFIQRFVIVVAIVAAAVPLAAQTIITNGDFELTGSLRGDGSMPPNEIRGWAAAYGRPQILAEGCDGPGSGAIAMRANLRTDAIRQPVALYRRVRYQVSLCARRRPGTSSKAGVVFRASTVPLGDSACSAPTCESVVNDVTDSWTRYEFQFTPTRDSVYLTLSGSDRSDGAFSWVEVDDVSITIADRCEKELAPLIHAGAPGTIPNQYIVLFKEGTSPAAVTSLIAQVEMLGGRILFRYTSDTLGFAVNVDNNPDALEVILQNAHVKSAENDLRVTSTFVTHDVRQNKGLDRIDQRSPVLNDSLKLSETGQGVHVYVFDTGVSPHAEFPNRLSSDPPNAFLDPIGGMQPTTDCNGHGTHVAGTLAGSTFGVAKNATIHPVRVIDCNGGGAASAVIAGVDWLTVNKVLPALANLSISGVGQSPSLDEKITNSIQACITYVVAAHNRADDACKYSPARLPDVITVGAANPETDVRYVVSNSGPCVDVFAPGTAIRSAWHTANNATMVKSGTSMAAPHVAGVAALYLETNPTATPADVWNKIHYNANDENTPNWGGVKNTDGTTASPNELLHWGPLSEGYGDGGQHLTTVDGMYYEFGGAGEYVMLRGPDLEIQTRQTPVATASDPGYDPYYRPAACMSITTAVAAKVGSHRVTYLPGPSGMEVRVDGNLVSLGANAIDLDGGGSVMKTAIGNGLRIQFPDDTVLTAVPGSWTSQRKWFLNVQVHHTRAAEGIMGAIADGSWLPALPDGTSLGPMPASPHERHRDLYQKFGNAWRVTQSTSLFDYAPGTSTETFTNRDWPPQQGPCRLGYERPVRPTNRTTARIACRGIRGERARANCISDVLTTGERAFATSYLLSQQLRDGATSTVVTAGKTRSAAGEKVTFTAMVKPLASSPKRVPRGTVQFFVDGSKVGEAVRLDDRGRASWTTTELGLDRHQISARYSPVPNSEFLPSSSAARKHFVNGKHR